MDVKQVLSHLREQFPEQLVLYAADLAKILSKSEKAVQQLIARGNLPFSVKSIGGRRCVDIFQVAEWFASQLDGAEEFPPTKPKRPRKSRLPADTQGNKGKKAPVKRSPIGSKLSEMRDARALAMLAQRVTDHEASLFVNELAKHVAFPNAGRYDAPVVVVCERVTTGFVSDAVITERQKCYLDSVSDARSFIHSFCFQQTPDVLSVRIVVQQGWRTIFDGFSTDGKSWFIDKNHMDLEL